MTDTGQTHYGQPMDQPFWTKLHDDTWGVKLGHTCSRPGDVVTVTRKDGTSSETVLAECLAEGAGYSLWRVYKPGEAPTPAPLKHVQAVKPKLRRGAQLTRVPRLPVLSPEPPPHTDADAPPMEADDGA